MNLSPNSSRLERWIGQDADRRSLMEITSQAMLHGGADGGRWYGPPIVIGNIPGPPIYAHGDGDFSGKMKAGEFMSYAEYYHAKLQRKLKRWAHRQMSTVNTGFTGISDMISEQSVGKGREWMWVKAGPTEAVAGTSTLWYATGAPSVGAAPSAGAGGRLPIASTAGAHPMDNPSSPDTRFLNYGSILTTVSGLFLLYDRIFDFLKTMNTSAETVSGVPTRFASTTPGNGYIGGNFMFPEISTVLGATAHNISFNYTDQAGNASTGTLFAGQSGGIVQRLDFPGFTWFAPIESGDTGVKALTQITLSAAPTGALVFVIGHALALFPSPVLSPLLNPINFQYGEGGGIKYLPDDAALAWLSVHSTATTAKGFQANLTTTNG